MKRSAYLLLLAMLFLARLCRADSTATNGNIVVVFPTSSWYQSAPTDLIRKSFDRNPNVKLAFHAVSSPAKLQLFATRCDYSSFNAPTDRALSRELAAYLNGVKMGFSNTAKSGIAEKFDDLARFPHQTIDVRLTNNNFIEIRTFFCSTHLYSFEIVGPAGSREEADNCLDGISLIHEQPVDAAVFASAQKILADGGPRSAAYESGRLIGLISGFVITGIVLIAIIISATQAHKTAKRPPPPIPLRRTTPPPLPASQPPPPSTGSTPPAPDA